MLTWAQLQIHNKPCGLLNIAGYFDPLLSWFDHAEAEGFVRPQHRKMLLVASDPSKLLQRFEEYRAPVSSKWTR
jgi:predicted Rossmann-fold nucleotide-binding protein